jgi:hypothetical protein
MKRKKHTQGSPASSSSSTAAPNTPTARRNLSNEPRSISGFELLSPAMRNSYQSEVFEFPGPHSVYGYNSGLPTPSPVIITSHATGFAWNRDVFLSRWEQERAGLGEEEYGGAANIECCETHDIILDDDDLIFGP